MLPSKMKRVILKLSGEIFKDKDGNVSFPQYDFVSRQLIKIAKTTKVELAVVVGGGNIFRGREANSEIDHNEADTMGMLATVINGVGLREALVRNSSKNARLMTAFDLIAFAEPYIRLKGRHHLDEGRIIILAGGLGKPNFSTDSAVAQYADELGCEIILKASTVDGVYDSDPRKNTKAKRLTSITYREALIKDLNVMDQTAFAMCMKSNIPIFVFDIKDLDKIQKVFKGDYSFGTLVSKTG
jgi:uridylate kinase